jgi:DNA-binding transcriptional regulator YiaG
MKPVMPRASKVSGAMNGAELKKLRYKLGLSLSQASRQVEVSVSTWCRWESGKQKIPEGAIKLFKLLNKVK